MGGVGAAAKAIVAAGKWLFTASSAGAIAARVAIGATISAVTGVLAKKAATYEPDLQSRTVMTRGTVEPQKRIYGEALVSGPLAYINTGGTKNRELWQLPMLAGHELTEISDVWLDDRVITNDEIANGSPEGGDVVSGPFGPKGPNTVVRISKYYGTATQNADATLVAEKDRFGVDLGWTNNHRLRGIAYLACRFTLFDRTESLWESGEPTNIRARVKGAKVYDPRQDDTRPTLGSGNQRTDDPNTWEYSNNPALCVIDYLRNEKFGLGMNWNRIKWPDVAAAADYCDELVSTPDGTEKRFTCNGALYASAGHEENIRNLLSSMNGQLTLSGERWYVRAGQYIAPDVTLNDDDLAGGLAISTALDRGERYNTIKAIFTDPDNGFKANETPDIFTTALRNRDNGEVLRQEITLPFTQGWFEAQRLAWQQLHVANQETQVVAPLNLRATAVRAGERVNFDVAELGWSPKVFDVVGWRITEQGGDDLGVEVSLREDSASAWDDPAVGDYATRTPAGLLTFGNRGTPTATSLQAIAQLEAIQLDWTNPDDFAEWKEVTLWASVDSNWNNASEVYTGRADSYLLPLPAGATRYFWVTYINDVGDPDDPTDARFPDSDTSSVFATASAITVGDIGDAGDLAGRDDVRFGDGTVKDGGGNTVPDSSVINGDDALAMGFNAHFSDWTDPGANPRGWASAGILTRESGFILTQPYSALLTADGTVETYLVARNGLLNLPEFIIPAESIVEGSIDYLIVADNAGDQGPGFVIDLVQDDGAGGQRYLRKVTEITNRTLGKWQRLYFKISNKDFTTNAGSYVSGDFDIGIRVWCMASHGMFGGSALWDGSILYDGLRFRVVTPDLEGAQAGKNFVTQYTPGNSPLLVTTSQLANNTSTYQQYPDSFQLNGTGRVRMHYEVSSDAEQLQGDLPGQVQFRQGATILGTQNHYGNGAFVDFSRDITLQNSEPVEVWIRAQEPGKTLSIQNVEVRVGAMGNGEAVV